MESDTALVLATALLVVAGFVQVNVLSAQNRHNQLGLIDEYRRRWNDYADHWARLVFIGREEGEYYQVAEKALIEQFIQERESTTLDSPSISALNSVRLVCSTLSDVTLKILQGELSIQGVYPIFGSELLRHCRPLRVLLDVYYPNRHNDQFSNQMHVRLQKELQDWLIYHDGIRRRCLILIDLLWAEAVRLNDLPPSDIKVAADAKKYSGPNRRKRLTTECQRLSGIMSSLRARALARHLKHAEYRSFFNWNGISSKKLTQMDDEWTKRLLRDYESRKPLQ